MKRGFDIVIATLVLILVSPVLVVGMALVWAQDRRSPFYVASRTGRDDRPFRMIKLRSMVVNADRSGVDSTGSDDRRITRIGRFIRKFKLDELPQLWNVLRGDMSLVGPRPNVKRETDLYTAVERRLLSARPGITDFASIVFSDEGEILKGAADPDIAYNQLIRPGKSRLGLFYVDRQSPWVDLRICFLTAVAILSRPRALRGIERLLHQLGADDELMRIARRASPLVASPPPGSDRVVGSRETRSA